MLFTPEMKITLQEKFLLSQTKIFNSFCFYFRNIYDNFISEKCGDSL